MDTMLRRTLVCLLVLAPGCAPLDSSAQAALRPPVTRIADAREAGAGATVLVEGIVTVAPGTLDDGFAVQDATGGLWVLPPTDPVRLEVGSRVRVHGTLDLPNEQLSLQPSAILALSPVAPPTPRAVATAEVGPATEGWLVRIRGRVTEAPVEDAPWGWKLTVDDGSGPASVFVDADSGVDPAAFRAGGEVEVIGFSGRYDDRYEVLPRSRADVRHGPG
jgi:hypothetical protein